MVTITDWRCATASCGKVIAERVDVRQGWVERRCRKCKRDSAVGDRPDQASQDVRCLSAECGVKLAEVATGFRGTVVIVCERCKARRTFVA